MFNSNEKSCDVEVPFWCTIMRGGTSKAVFVQEKDIPPPSVERDEMLLHLIDGYNLHSIDGLGGGYINTSKIAIVNKSKRPDADVECEFVQIGSADKTISYEIFCGNICSAVGPYAVDNQLVTPLGDQAIVRIFNKNINKILEASFPLSERSRMIHGKNIIHRVLQPGASIFLDFTKTLKNAMNQILPTGNIEETITLDNAQTFKVTLLNLINPCIFINAQELGVSGLESSHDLTQNSALMNTVHQLRKTCASYFNLTDSWSNEKGHGPLLPYAILVAPKNLQSKHAINLEIRTVHLKECHPSIPASIGIPTAIATLIPGSIPFTLSNHYSENNLMYIGHPNGEMPIEINAHWNAEEKTFIIERLGYTRTARRIMDGWTYIQRNHPKLTTQG
jgi:2-methylaconitate isomerase